MLIQDCTFISCPAERVWEASIDIDTWHLWTPTVQTARRLDNGPLGIGSTACIKQPMQPSTIWRVMAFDDGVSFAWETSGKLFHMRATHAVENQIKGSSCTLTVELIGPIAKLLAPLLAPFIGCALRQENRGLKRWCEGGC